MLKNLCKPSDTKIKLLLYIIFAAISVYYGIHLSIPLVLDEVGTVANTAFLAGDDWSLCVQSMGGFYYKYGVSALYLPIYLIFRNNPFMMYKTIMALHMLIISFIPVIAYHICRKHLKIESWKKALLLAVASGGISSLWLYSLYARSDMMLIFLPWLIVLILLELSTCTKTENKIKRNVLSLILAIVSVYAYMSHSRGIVLIIATFMTLLFMSIVYRKHIASYIVYLPTTAVMLVIDKMLSSYIKNGVYGEYGTRHASMESFDFDAFMKIFTPQGFIIELKLCIGWLFNLFASSMGLVIIGTFATVIIIFVNIKKRQGTDQENIFAVFSLLCLLGTFAMGALFFFPHIYDLMIGVELNRADRMIYGRYTVGAVAPICLMALYALVYKNNLIIKWKSKILALVTYIAVFALFITKVSPSLTNVPKTNARYFLSLTGFLKIVKGKTNAAFPDLTDALFKAGIAALIAFVIILVLTSIKKKEVIYSACILTFALSVINFNHVFGYVRNGRDDVAVKKSKNVINYFNDLKGLDEISEQYHTVFFARNAYLLKSYQFGLPGFDVSSYKYIKDSKNDSFFVICKKTLINEAIDECAKIYGNDNYFTLDDFNYKKAKRDVIIIKGDDLANSLREKGYSLQIYNNK